MNTPEPIESVSPSLLDRAKSLRTSVLDRVTSMTDSGKQMIADRRDEQRRKELLGELGALHFAVANGEDLDLTEAERIIAELSELDAVVADEADTDAEADEAE